jgi:hypothetical protein
MYFCIHIGTYPCGKGRGEKAQEKHAVLWNLTYLDVI